MRNSICAQDVIASQASDVTNQGLESLPRGSGDVDELPGVIPLEVRPGDALRNINTPEGCRLMFKGDRSTRHDCGMITARGHRLQHCENGCQFVDERIAREIFGIFRLIPYLRQDRLRAPVSTNFLGDHQLRSALIDHQPDATPEVSSALGTCSQ